jgi:hypothetical protein
MPGRRWRHAAPSPSHLRRGAGASSSCGATRQTTSPTGVPNAITPFEVAVTAPYSRAATRPDDDVDNWQRGPSPGQSMCSFPPTIRTMRPCYTRPKAATGIRGPTARPCPRGQNASTLTHNAGSVLRLTAGCRVILCGSGAGTASAEGSQPSRWHGILETAAPGTRTLRATPSPLHETLHQGNL